MSQNNDSQIYKIEIKENFIFNNIKVHIYTRTWEPVGTKPKANIVFVHGHAEHVTRYDNVFRKFAEIGIMTQGFDQVGCGKTGERSKDLGGALGLSRVMLDITDAIDRLYDPTIPLFLMGHSFGGSSILNYLAMGERREKLHGAIATAPCLQVADEARPFFPIQMLIEQMASIFPLLKVPVNLDAQLLSRDDVEVRKYGEDPLVFSRSSLVQVRDILYEGESFMTKRCAQVQVPRLIILHGTADKVTSHNASAITYEKLKELGKIPHLEFKSYKGAYHELTNDIIKDEVIQHMILWISKHL